MLACVSLDDQSIFDVIATYPAHSIATPSCYGDSITYHHQGQLALEHSCVLETKNIVDTETEAGDKRLCVQHQ